MALLDLLICFRGLSVEIWDRYLPTLQHRLQCILIILRNGANCKLTPTRCLCRKRHCLDSLFSIGVVPRIDDPVPLLCDNNGAIAQSKESRSHSKSKHVLRQYHLIREFVERKYVIVDRIPSAHPTLWKKALWCWLTCSWI